MAKAARKRAVSYELTCPHCGATVLAPGGSTFWTLEEMDNVKSSSAMMLRYISRIVPCEECQQSVRIPKGQA